MVAAHLGLRRGRESGLALGGAGLEFFGGRLRLAVDGTPAFGIHCSVGCSSLAAHVRRAEDEAWLFAVSEAAAEAGNMAEMISASGGGPAFAAAWDWLTGCGPPLAALVCPPQRAPDNGMVSVAMCLAAAFFGRVN